MPLGVAALYFKVQNIPVCASLLHGTSNSSCKWGTNGCMKVAWRVIN